MYKVKSFFTQYILYYVEFRFFNFSQINLYEIVTYDFFITLHLAESPIKIVVELTHRKINWVCHQIANPILLS